jgi:hypothetical protein
MSFPKCMELLIPFLDENIDFDADIILQNEWRHKKEAYERDQNCVVLMDYIGNQLNDIIPGNCPPEYLHTIISEDEETHVTTDWSPAVWCIYSEIGFMGEFNSNVLAEMEYWLSQNLKVDFTTWQKKLYTYCETSQLAKKYKRKEKFKISYFKNIIQMILKVNRSVRQKHVNKQQIREYIQKIKEIVKNNNINFRELKTLFTFKFQGQDENIMDILEYLPDELYDTPGASRKRKREGVGKSGSTNISELLLGLEALFIPERVSL